MRTIALVLVLAACGKGDGKSAAHGGFDKLQVTVDGAPLAVDRAFVKRSSPGVYSVLVGAGKGSCESLLAGTNEGDGTAFGFTVHQRVAPNGDERHELVDLWSRDVAVTARPAATIAFAGDADKGTQTTIELPSIAGKLALSGRLTAVGCGEVPPAGAGVPKAPHPSKAAVLIANKRLDVRGVTVQVRAGAGAADLPNITISTGPKDCSGVELPAPVILERADGKWTLRGTWFAAPIAGDAEASPTNDLAFSANNVGKSVDGPTLMLQLSGTGKLGDYTVQLVGSVEAIECVR